MFNSKPGLLFAALLMTGFSACTSGVVDSAACHIDSDDVPASDGDPSTANVDPNPHYSGAASTGREAGHREH